MKVVSAVLRLGLPGIRDSESLAWDQAAPWTKRRKKRAEPESGRGKEIFYFLFIYLFFLLFHFDRFLPFPPLRSLQ